MRAIQRLTSSEFARFAAVGALGFVVDAGVLLALTSLAQFQPTPARAVSFGVALLATWAANRAWTFRVEGGAPVRRIAAEAGRYVAVQLTGAALNFLVFSAMIGWLGREPSALMSALATGSLAGMAVNYIGSRQFVFKRAA